MGFKKRLKKVGKSISKGVKSVGKFVGKIGSELGWKHIEDGWRSLTTKKKTDVGYMSYPLLGKMPTFVDSVLAYSIKETLPVGEVYVDSALDGEYQTLRPIYNKIRKWDSPYLKLDSVDILYPNILDPTEIEDILQDYFGFHVGYVEHDKVENAYMDFVKSPQEASALVEKAISIKWPQYNFHPDFHVIQADSEDDTKTYFLAYVPEIVGLESDFHDPNDPEEDPEEDEEEAEIEGSLVEIQSADIQPDGSYITAGVSEFVDSNTLYDGYIMHLKSTYAELGMEVVDEEELESVESPYDETDSSTTHNNILSGSTYTEIGRTTEGVVVDRTTTRVEQVLHRASEDDDWEVVEEEVLPTITDEVEYTLTKVLYEETRKTRRQIRERIYEIIIYHDLDLVDRLTDPEIVETTETELPYTPEEGSTGEWKKVRIEELYSPNIVTDVTKVIREEKFSRDTDFYYFFHNHIIEHGAIRRALEETAESTSMRTYKIFPILPLNPYAGGVNSTPSFAGADDYSKYAKALVNMDYKEMRKSSLGPYASGSDTLRLSDIKSSYVVRGALWRDPSPIITEYIFHFLSEFADSGDSPRLREYNTLLDLAIQSEQDYANWELNGSVGDPPRVYTRPTLPPTKIVMETYKGTSYREKYELMWKSIQVTNGTGKAKSGAKKGDIWKEIAGVIKHDGRDQQSVAITRQVTDNTWEKVLAIGLSCTAYFDWNGSKFNRDIYSDATFELGKQDDFVADPDKFEGDFHEDFRMMYFPLSLEIANRMSLVKRQDLYREAVVYSMGYVYNYRVKNGFGRFAKGIENAIKDPTNLAIALVVSVVASPMAGMQYLAMSAIISGLSASGVLSYMEDAFAGIFGERVGRAIGRAVVTVVIIVVAAVMLNEGDFENAKELLTAVLKDPQTLMSAGTSAVTGYDDARTQEKLTKIQEQSQEDFLKYREQQKMFQNQMKDFANTEGIKEAFSNFYMTPEQFLTANNLDGQDIVELTLASVTELAERFIEVDSILGE